MTATLHQGHDHSTLRFELDGTDDPPATTLVFTHTFVHEPGKPARDAAGWEACFEHFDAVLAGGDVPRAAREDMTSWARHHEAYLARFGDLTVEAGGTWERVRLQGPPHDLDGRTAINVTVGETADAGVLVVAAAGAELEGGAAVEVLGGTVEAPGEVLLAGVLHDPLTR